LALGVVQAWASFVAGLIDRGRTSILEPEFDRVSEDDDKVLPFVQTLKPGTVVTEVGGIVDETKVTLALYVQDLEPNEITELLGVEPTSAHRCGDVRGRGVRPYPKGAWFLELVATPPRGPEELLGELLERLPPSSAPVWATLRERFDVQVRFGIFLDAWNRGFGVPAGQLQQLAVMVDRFEFDIYANGEEDG
jgi:hypothetical protein